MTLTDDRVKQEVGASDEYWATSKTFILAIARAIETAACAERDARIAELERQLAEARKQMEIQKDEWLSWEAKRKALGRDAERYRWLRDVAHPDYGPAVAEHQCNDWGRWYYAFPSSAELDAAIDNAMKEQT